MELQLEVTDVVPSLQSCSFASSGRAGSSRVQSESACLLICCKDMIVLSMNLCGPTHVP